MNKRVLLKLSGEALRGNQESPYDLQAIKEIVENIKLVADQKIQIGLVIGGGNIYRGHNIMSMTSSKMQNTQIKGDQMGMLSTLTNALFLEQIMKNIYGLKVRVFSAINIPSICQFYQPEEANKSMESSEIAIFAGGIGTPFFTTDTAAVLRAIETGCDLLIKATLVDGIYSSNPALDTKAEKIKQITYQEILTKRLKVMDMTAIALAQEYNMPIKICSIKEKGSLIGALNNQGKFTLVTQ